MKNLIILIALLLNSILLFSQAGRYELDKLNNTINRHNGYYQVKEPLQQVDFSTYTKWFKSELIDMEKCVADIIQYYDDYADYQTKYEKWKRDVEKNDQRLKSQKYSSDAEALGAIIGTYGSAVITSPSEPENIAYDNRKKYIELLNRYKVGIEIREKIKNFSDEFLLKFGDPLSIYSLNEIPSGVKENHLSTIRFIDDGDIEKTDNHIRETRKPFIFKRDSSSIGLSLKDSLVYSLILAYHSEIHKPQGYIIDTYEFIKRAKETFPNSNLPAKYANFKYDIGSMHNMALNSYESSASGSYPKSNRISDLNKFISYYRYSKLVATAEANIKSLKDSDEPDWQNAKAENTRLSYSSYINAHPDGRYADEARKLWGDFAKRLSNYSYVSVLAGYHTDGLSIGFNNLRREMSLISFPKDSYIQFNLIELTILNGYINWGQYDPWGRKDDEQIFGWIAPLSLGASVAIGTKDVFVAAKYDAALGLIASNFQDKDLSFGSININLSFSFNAMIFGNGNGITLRYRIRNFSPMPSDLKPFSFNMFEFGFQWAIR